MLFPKVCFKCGKPDHQIAECTAADFTCYNCKQVGHQIKQCIKLKSKSRQFKKGKIGAKALSEAQNCTIEENNICVPKMPSYFDALIEFEYF